MKSCAEGNARKHEMPLSFVILDSEREWNGKCLANRPKNMCEKNRLCETGWDPQTHNRTWRLIVLHDFRARGLIRLCDSPAGDGNVSFEEFVEIVSNIGASTAAPTDQHQEEQELRDAFRVSEIGTTSWPICFFRAPPYRSRRRCREYKFRKQ